MSLPNVKPKDPMLMWKILLLGGVGAYLAHARKHNQTLDGKDGLEIKVDTGRLAASVLPMMLPNAGGLAANLLAGAMFDLVRGKKK